MAGPDSCDPCGTCIPPNMNEQWFWQALLNTQCEIIAAIEGGGGIADNVNVLSVIPGVGATNLGKAEDAAAVSGDVGVAMLLKRTDTAAAQTDTTGDYTLPVANSFGAQQINIDSTFQATAATGLLKLEDAAHASGDAGVAAWGVANTALAAFGANGDYTPHATSTKGVGLHTIVYDADIAITATPIKLEDAAFSNGDPMLMAGAVNNRSYGSYNSTNGDATPISVGDRGVVLTTLMYDSSMGGGSCAIVPEDQAISNGQATVLNGFQRQDTPTVDTDTSGDCALAKSNSVGALYTEQANQVAVPALGTLGFAGVTTTYATLLTNSAKGLILSVDNKLDKDVYISTNGSTDHYFVAAGGSKIIDFGSNGRWVASNISVKSIGANATSGNIYATVVS